MEEGGEVVGEGGEVESGEERGGRRGSGGGRRERKQEIRREELVIILIKARIALIERVKFI